MAIEELIGRLSVEDEFIFDDIRIFSDCTSNTLPHPFKNGVFLQVNYSRFEFSPYISEEELSESLRKILRHNQLIIIGKTELDANLVLHIAMFHQRGTEEYKMKTFIKLQAFSELHIHGKPSQIKRPTTFGTNVCRTLTPSGLKPQSRIS